MSLPQPKTWSGPNRTGSTQLNMVEKIGRRVLSVTRTEELAPHYRRIYLSGEALERTFPYVRLAPTDHVKVYFPPEGHEKVTLPERGPSGFGPDVDGGKPHFRDYTVCGYLEESNELVLEFTTQGPGRASRWGAAAAPGSQLGVLGPRSNIIFPENYAHYLLAGDETALPALARFLEELPPAASVRVIAEVASVSERVELPKRPGAVVSWVYRDDAGSLVSEVLKEPLPDNDDWFLFAAGEAGALRELRQHFRLELGLPRERVVLDGYWMRGVQELDRRGMNLNG